MGVEFNDLVSDLMLLAELEAAIKGVHIESELETGMQQHDDG